MMRDKASFCLAKLVRAAINCCWRVWSSTRDRGNNAGFLLIGGSAIERLRGFDLGLRCFHPRSAGDGFQVGVPRHQDHQFAGILVGKLGSFQALCGGTLLLDVTPIEHGLIQKSANIKIVKRSYDARKTGEAKTEGGQTGLLHILLTFGHYIRQQVAEFFPFGATSGKGIVLGKQQPEVLLETAVDRLQKGNG